MNALLYLKNNWRSVVVLLSFAFVFWSGSKIGGDKVQAKWNTKKAEQEKIIAELKAKQAEKTVEVVTEYVDRVQVVKEKGQTIIKEVPIYVQNDADLSGGFRVFHDAAASNELPDSARIADAPTVTAQEAATTIAENYQRCHENVEQLIALQSWVKQ